MNRQFYLLPAAVLCLCSLTLGLQAPATTPVGVEVTLERVAAIHGAAGPFAVAGYRMGEAALHELGTNRGSFSLDVTHRTPMRVQFSCIADGWQAATGVSAGKLNLHLVEVRPENTETIILDKKTGKTLVFRLRKQFLQKYLDLPEKKQKEAGREVAELPDDQIFTVSSLPSSISSR
jgi:formylmethanofuran dehydrogenase subunit E